MRKIPEGVFPDEPRLHFITEGSVTSDKGKERPFYWVLCRPCGYMWGYHDYGYAEYHRDQHKHFPCTFEYSLEDHKKQLKIGKLVEARDRAVQQLQELGYKE